MKYRFALCKSSDPAMKLPCYNMCMFSDKLARLRGENLLRRIQDRESGAVPRIRMQGNEYLNFSSNDYLGFAGHPYLAAKAKESMSLYGFGAGASRLMAGGSILHQKLEKKIAQFKSTEAAAVFNSGYAANTGIIPALAEKGAVVFSDELNHASIIDGCRLSRAETVIYNHKDMTHLEECLKKSSAATKLVVTDSVFSMDGDIAPLPEIFRLCRTYSAYLYVDEAHATGVIGGGRGSLPHFHLKSEPWVFQMGTFSKALGSFGAFFAAAAGCIEWITNTSRSFMYSTALPASVVAASIAALELIERESHMIGLLWKNRDKAARGIAAAGFDIMGSETPIIPVRTGGVGDALRTAQHLLDHGIFAPAIRPPSVKEPRIRITVTAAHTDEDIERLIEALKKM